jgi:xylan 1,4-beta-xylosidase
MLGRETAIEKVDWPEGEWPRLATGGNEPSLTVPLPAGSKTVQTPRKAEEHFRFDCDEIPRPLQRLRLPAEEFASLKDRPGLLRLYGRESMSSPFCQALLGHRVDHPLFSVSTALEFDPRSFQQSAGLAAYYDMSSYYYLHLSFDEERGRVLHLQCCRHSEFEYPVYNISVPNRGAVHLKVKIDGGELQFYWSIKGKDWNPVGPRLKTDTISDDFEPDMRFTGAFCALACQDLTGTSLPADFEYMKVERG